MYEKLGAFINTQYFCLLYIGLSRETSLVLGTSKQHTVLASHYVRIKLIHTSEEVLKT